LVVKKEVVKTGLKRLPNGLAFHSRTKNCRLWYKTSRGLLWVEKRWFHFTKPIKKSKPVGKQHLAVPKIVQHLLNLFASGNAPM